VNQNVAEQFLDLAAVAREIFGVLLERAELVQHHAAMNTPLQRRVLVLRKIDPRPLPQHGEDFAEHLMLARGRRFIGLRLVGHHIRMLGQVRQLPRNPLGRQHEIHAARPNRARRHPRIFRGLFVLRERNAARRLDRPTTFRAIRPVPRQNYANRAMTFLVGQRAEEFVDRQMRILARR